MAKSPKQRKAATVIGLAVIVIVAAAAGVMSQPMVSKAVSGGGQHEVKYVMPDAISFPEPLLFNLGDPRRGGGYAKIGFAVQLDKMTEGEHHDLLESLGYSDSGGHRAHSAGPDEALARLGRNPSLHDATISVVTRYTSKQLLSTAGREQMKQELIQAMNEAEDERPGKPRYRIHDVLFTEYIVQA